MLSRREQFQALVAQQPDNELFRFSLAQSLVGEGRFEESLPHFEFCVRKKADWMMAWIGLGKALLQLGLKEKGQSALTAALQLSIVQQHEEPESELRALLKDLDGNPSPG